MIQTFHLENVSKILGKYFSVVDIDQLYIPQTTLNHSDEYIYKELPMDTNDMYVVIKGPVYLTKKNADGSIYQINSPIQCAREQESVDLA